MYSACREMRFESEGGVAQMEERRTPNPEVAGSSPAIPVKLNILGSSEVIKGGKSYGQE